MILKCSARERWWPNSWHIPEFVWKNRTRSRGTSARTAIIPSKIWNGYHTSTSHNQCVSLSFLCNSLLETNMCVTDHYLPHPERMQNQDLLRVLPFPPPFHSRSQQMCPFTRFSATHKKLLLLSGIYNHLRVWAASFYRFRDHTQARTTAGRTPLDEWSARCKNLYLTTHIQHSQRTTIHAPGGIRTRNPSKWSAVDTRPRPLGHWDRHTKEAAALNYDQHILTVIKMECLADVLQLSNREKWREAF